VEERTLSPALCPKVEKYLHHLRLLEHYPLKTAYTTIADHVRDLLRGPPFTTPERAKGRVVKLSVQLVVDETGVGAAVTDLLKERHLNYIGVTITGLGQKVNRNGMREYSVPKMDLVAALEVAFHKGTLKGAKGLELWPALREELLNFRRKQNARTAHISYEHWRESDHDGLVLAAALACWKAAYQRKGNARLKVVY
jgi:hypothetical protein